VGRRLGRLGAEFNTALAELGDVSEITLHINSPGGEVYEGIAILNACAGTRPPSPRWSTVWPRPQRRSSPPAPTGLSWAATPN
jgi:hypothetical protein